MVRKRAKPSDDAHEQGEISEESGIETTPLGEEIVDEETNPEDEVTDITETVLSSLLSEEEINELHEALGEARRQAAENLDGWQRARAEFANYRKRIERERMEERARITGEIACKYLGVLDDIERALKDRPQNPELGSWAEGIDLIYRKMRSILDSEGVELISTEGELFNPNFHEAISQEESDDHDEGEIIEVIQLGYKIGDRVLRPAIVRVAK